MSLRRLMMAGVDLTSLIVGLVTYMLTHTTPSFSYQSLIRLFCYTGGVSSDVLSRLVGLVKGKYNIQMPVGVLGDIAGENEIKIVSTLRERGFYIFPRRLADDVCDRLLQFATTHVCQMRLMDGEKLGAPLLTTYHRNSPKAVRYDFSTQDIINNPDVQALMSDLSLIAVAQSYLGTKPVIDVTSMWWHTAYSDKPDMEAAQYFHFDMDRPKWLKFFIYLTDVTLANGPHTFVAGSQKTGAIPDSLLRKGYARLTDEEVKQSFNEQDIVEFSAPRGTIIAEDTRGLHKGRHVDQGDRLMLQIQFSNTLFGTAYTKSKFNNAIAPELQLRIEQYPGLYASYL
jgi:hypothetical protein